MMATVLRVTQSHTRILPFCRVDWDELLTSAPEALFSSSWPEATKTPSLCTASLDKIDQLERFHAAINNAFSEENNYACFLSKKYCFFLYFMFFYFSYDFLVDAQFFHQFFCFQIDTNQNHLPCFSNIDTAEETTIEKFFNLKFVFGPYLGAKCFKTWQPWRWTWLRECISTLWRKPCARSISSAAKTWSQARWRNCRHCRRVRQCWQCAGCCDSRCLDSHSCQKHTESSTLERELQ